jgi:hypothetical protein
MQWIVRDLDRLRTSTAASLALWHYDWGEDDDADRPSIERELHAAPLSNLYGHVTEVSDLWARVLTRGYRRYDLGKVTHTGFGDALRDPGLAAYASLWTRLVQVAAQDDPAPLVDMQTDVGRVVAGAYAMLMEAARQHLAARPSWQVYARHQQVTTEAGHRLFDNERCRVSP